METHIDPSTGLAMELRREHAGPRVRAMSRLHAARERALDIQVGRTQGERRRMCVCIRAARSARGQGGGWAHPRLSGRGIRCAVGLQTCSGRRAVEATWVSLQGLACDARHALGSMARRAGQGAIGTR